MDNDKLKHKDLRPKKETAKKFNINIKIYKPKVNLEKAPRRMVYGQKQYKEKIYMNYSWNVWRSLSLQQRDGCLDTKVGMLSLQTSIY